MTHDRITHGGLSISAPLASFVSEEAAAGLNLDPEDFWSDFTAAYREEIADLAAHGCRYLQIDDHTFVQHRYWQPDYRNETGRAIGEAQFRDVRSALRRAVAAECARGERVGCFLSGGVDSSTIASLLGEVTEAPPRTYSRMLSNWAA